MMLRSISFAIALATTSIAAWAEPVLAPFSYSISGSFQIFITPSPAGPTVLNVTNAEKLSLPGDTAVGTQVSVSDGFYVSGLGDARDGFYFASPADAMIFIKSLPFIGDGLDIRVFSNGTWIIGNDDIGYDVATASGGTNPWDRSYATAIFIHPALQQLATPSTAQGGVFVLGGTQDGVYEIIGNDENGNIFYGLRGQSVTATGAYSIFRYGLDDPPHVVFRWELWDSHGLLYYSLSEVATPYLATDWKNASDDSPASITVTSVTVGDLVAGNKLGSVVRIVNGSLNGRNKYTDVLGVAADLTWDSTKWTDGTTDGSGNTAFPDIGTADPVAGEANWEAVP